MTGVVMEKTKVQKVTLGARGRSAFEDLGFDEAESAELKRKADLMTQLEQYIARNRLTQARAAEVFGVTQPRVSDLINGKLSVFSLDELVRMYDATGSSVRLVFVEDARREDSVLRRLIEKGAGAFAALARAGRASARGATPRKRAKRG